jgi:hypothetical protein
MDTLPEYSITPFAFSFSATRLKKKEVRQETLPNITLSARLISKYISALPVK